MISYTTGGKTPFGRTLEPRADYHRTSDFSTYRNIVLCCYFQFDLDKNHRILEPHSADAIAKTRMGFTISSGVCIPTLLLLLSEDLSAGDNWSLYAIRAAGWDFYGRILE